MLDSIDAIIQKVVELNLKSSKSKRKKEPLFSLNLLLFVTLIVLLFFISFQRYRKINSFPDFIEGTYISDEEMEFGVYKIDRVNGTDRLENNSSAESLVAYNPNSYEIFYSDNVNERRAIASLTKMMTALVVLDYWEIDEQIEVVQKPETAEYNLGLKVGDKFSVEEGLKVILIKSYNDVAQAFADSYEGGEEAFINKMNEKAENLGMNSTLFSNSSGLTDDDNYSTARDLQKLTKHFMKNKKLMDIVNMKYAVVTVTDSAGRDQNFNIYTTNKLSAEGFDGVRGIKTGYTGKAGECYITYYDSGSESNKDDLILIILDSENRFADAKKILNSIN